MTDIAEFEVLDYTYRAGRIDAMTQFHITRRLATVLASFKDVAKLAGDGASIGIDALEPVAVALGRLPDEDVEYIIGKALAVVSRRKGNDTGWAQIWNSAAKRPMFDDIEMPQMLMITMHVVQATLSPFLPGLPFKSDGGPKA